MRGPQRAGSLSCHLPAGVSVSHPIHPARLPRVRPAVCGVYTPIYTPAIAPLCPPCTLLSISLSMSGTPRAKCQQKVRRQVSCNLKLITLPGS